jgi:hypothetical protein
MLALAEQLNNVSLACKRASISRSHYYEIKEAFEKFGADGLAPQPKRKPRMPNQTPPELKHHFELFLAISQMQHRRTGPTAAVFPSTGQLSSWVGIRSKLLQCDADNPMIETPDGGFSTVPHATSHRFRIPFRPACGFLVGAKGQIRGFL